MTKNEVINWKYNHLVLSWPFSNCERILPT